MLSNSFNNNIELNENQINSIDENYKILRKIMESNISDIQIKERDLKEKKVIMKSKMSEIFEILNVLKNYEK